MKLQGNNGCFNLTKQIWRMHDTRDMIRNIACVMLFCFLFPCVLYSTEYADSPSAQNPLNLTYKSTLVGMGGSSVYDSYLSPMKYTGTGIGLIYEEMKRTGLSKGRIFSQQLFLLEASDTRNPAGTAASYSGMLNYDYGLFYRFQPVGKLRLSAGMQADGLLGFIYNLRNGNNYASAKFHLNLNLSGMATYMFRIKKQPIRLRYQLNIPTAGVLFSPDFGQSYYEIGMGKNNDLFHFASFQNQLIVRNLLSVELPFKICTVRLAYMNNLYETQINQLKAHLASNAFYIGLSKQFVVVSERKPNKSYINVFE